MVDRQTRSDREQDFIRGKAVAQLQLTHEGVREFEPLGELKTALRAAEVPQEVTEQAFHDCNAKVPQARRGVNRESGRNATVQAAAPIASPAGLVSGDPRTENPSMTAPDPIRASFEEAAQTLRSFLESSQCLAGVQHFADAAADALSRGGLLMSCGNGGSMCDAMHFAEEWTGRFRGNRKALAAVAFADPSQLTCIANDFGFDEVFARQVEALGKPGDLLVAISTSGNSPNILRACEVAKARGVKTVGLLGKGGGQLQSRVDIPIVVPLAQTSDRIQEVHIKVLHIVIEAVERRMFPTNYATRA